MAQKKRYNVLGLMSGTSLDGLDLAYVEFELNQERWDYQILKAQTVSFPNALKEKIRQNEGLKSRDDLEGLDIELAGFFSSCITEFIKSDSLKVDFVSSHGQTIHHDPKNGISLQLGSGKHMSKLINLPVVSNFREQDIKLGGQGAPLVPIGDLLLFPSFNYCLNLGGIANISQKESNTMVAYDISICNTALNYFARKEGFEYDYKGQLGFAGQRNNQLFDALNQLEYHTLFGPKSLDSSFFFKVMLPEILKFDTLSNRDILSTLTHYIAYQINRSIQDSQSKVLITGGGSHNDFLLLLLKETFDIKVEKTDKIIIDYKEALIFAFLGVLRMRKEVNVLATVTGAAKDHCSGQIHVNGIEQERME